MNISRSEKKVRETLDIGVIVSYFPRVHWWWAPYTLDNPYAGGCKHWCTALQPHLSSSMFSVQGSSCEAVPMGTLVPLPWVLIWAKGPFSWLCFLWFLISNATEWTINQQSIPASASSLLMVWGPILFQALV